MAFTTGARVGCLLPPQYGARKDDHVPIKRDMILKRLDGYHIWQPQSKTDREGRGRLLIVNRTLGNACPVRALTELLLSDADEENRLFSTRDGFSTCEWFLQWLRYYLQQAGVLNPHYYSVRSCRSGACTASTLSKMPEYFTDTLGNWHSRARETYRRTARAGAQKLFCEQLGRLDS